MRTVLHQNGQPALSLKTSGWKLQTNGCKSGDVHMVVQLFFRSHTFGSVEIEDDALKSLSVTEFACVIVEVVSLDMGGSRNSP